MLDGIRDGRPGDRRGFIHKKILGGISKIAGVGAAIGIPGAGTVSRITGAFSGGRRTLPRTATARVTPFSQAQKNLGREAKFGGPAFRSLTSFATIPETGPCLDPALVRAPDGHCVAPGSGHFRQHFGTTVGGPGMPVGEAVMGQYGAGLVPGSMAIDRAVCLRGMQLGNDGICYNKSQISNKQRMWPAGRRPLLTGGDMRAISIAARAGRRLELTTKRLQKMGMIKKAASSRRPALRIPVHERITEAHVTK